MTHTTQDIERARDAVCGPLVRMLQPLSSMSQEDFSGAVLFPVLVAANGEWVSNEDASKIIEFFEQIRSRAALLQLVMCGCADASVVNGEPSVKLNDNIDTWISAMERYGLAVKKDST